MLRAKMAFYPFSRRRVRTIFLAVFLAAAPSLPGCGSLGTIAPAAPEIHDEINRRCRSHFADRPWQIVQSFTAYMPDGEVRNAIGVTRIDPEQKRIECVITSLEGIVLFHGQYDQKTEILRGVPPFDGERFASTLFDDIRLVFFPPGSQPLETGQTPSGTPVCRYERNGGFMDILLREDGRREIRRYSGRRTHIKTIALCHEMRCSRHVSGETGETGETGEIPLKIEISDHGFLMNYRLELELIKATLLPSDE